MNKKDIQRFWDKTFTNGACLEWTGSLDGRGYGKFVTWDGTKHKYHIASRVAWELENGPIPKGKQVCHTCDNTKCVKSEHLFVGSRSDNMRDMVHKGRNDYRVGESNPRAKLTFSQVKEIRALRAAKVFASTIAAKFGIKVKTVYNLCDPKQKQWSGRRGMKGIKD
jgi:hypothetical protein